MEITEVEQARTAAKDRLEALHNVVGLGVGVKETGGEITDELCVRVYVSTKIPASALAAEELVPPSIDGVPTDVIELRSTVPLSDTLVRPPCSASQITRVGFLGIEQAYGTICAFVRQDKKSYLLTCAHVLNPALLGGIDPIDSRVYQPYPITWANCIATQSITKLQDGTAPDCGLAELESEFTDSHTNKIMGGSVRLSQTGTVLYHQQVAKTGAKTDTTTGTVVDVSYSGQLVGRQARDCFIISPPQGSIFADHGDSGSPVYLPGQGANTALLGMLFTAATDRNPQMVFAQKIQNVFNSLEVTLDIC